MGSEGGRSIEGEDLAESGRPEHPVGGGLRPSPSQLLVHALGTEPPRGICDWSLTGPLYWYV